MHRGGAFTISYNLELYCMPEGANPFHPDKVLLHSDKLTALAEDRMIAPQTVEVDLTDGACNQACVHCCFSSGEGNNLVRINEGALLETLEELYGLGTRAVELVGGGEPTAHPKVTDIITAILDIGAGDMEVGIITNGLLANKLLPVAERMKFIRVSLDTASPETYQTLHGVPRRQFDKVLSNIVQLREVVPNDPESRRLGLGYLVVPPYNHQVDEVVAGATLANELKVDYITYRPAEMDEVYSAEYWQEAQLAIHSVRALLKEQGSQTAVFGGSGNRWETLRPGQHPTGKCDSKPLVAVIRADGGIARCILYRNEKAMDVGNIYDGSFAEQWFSEKHVQAWEDIDVACCPNPCKHYGYNEKVRAVRESVQLPMPAVKDVAHHNFV